MPEPLKICVDVISPVSLRKLRQTSSALDRIRLLAVAPTRSIWPNGSTLRIKFIGGTPSEHALIEQVASEWLQHANLRFQFVDEGASEIRISFVQDGRSWSYLGTDCLNIPSQAATMNFGWMLERGTILHEFGHAIGLGHEHQNPTGGIAWNEPVVIRDLSGPPNEWDEDTIRHNVLNKYRQDQVRSTIFDPDSIMLYAFPARWNFDGISTRENEVLSPADKRFIGSPHMYRFLVRSEPEALSLPVVENPGIVAGIGRAGERDLFTFVASRAGTYTIETVGSTDVVMRVFGPNNRTSLIAEDDDSGAGTNARLSLNLDSGEYFVQIRHFNPNIANGAYVIKVSFSA